MAVNYVRQYVRAIRAGTVTVSQPVRQVYERLDAEAADKACPYRFSAKLGDHAIRFIETFCRHYEGEHAGQLVKLELWEKAFIQTLFGWVDKKTRLRRFREFFLLVARKNGKSFLSACIMVYMLVADGDQGGDHLCHGPRHGALPGPLPADPPAGVRPRQAQRRTSGGTASHRRCQRSGGTESGTEAEGGAGQMTPKELRNILLSAGIPVAYRQFEEGNAPALPWAVYYATQSDNFAADGGVYVPVQGYAVELYADKKDPSLEAAVEAVLNQAGVFWQKDETYIESEKMHEVIYEFEVLA